MPGTARLKLSQDHLVTLRALEVLSLMTDHMEKQGATDPADIHSLFGFFRDVAHRCLENTEKALLLPFMENGLGMTEKHRVVRTIERHRQVDALLEELEAAFRAGQHDEFIAASRRYTGVMGDLIFDEDEFLPALIRPHYADQEVQRILAEFDKAEMAIANQARIVGPTLHRLESKYVTPHCI